MNAILEKYSSVTADKVTNWYKAGVIGDFEKDGGVCVKYNDKQIAVYYFARRDEWYACQNVCPHKMEMVLSRGMIGTAGEEPKVACPMHKKTFSLKDGKGISDESYEIAVYPVKVEGDGVFIGFVD